MHDVGEGEREPRIKVVFEPDGNTIITRSGSSIFEAATKAGNSIRFECGGKGKCGKCRVIINDTSAVTDMNEYEEKHLSQSDVNAGYRLACQAIVHRNVSVFVPPESRIESRRIQTSGYEKEIAIDPLIKKIHINMAKPTLTDVMPDYERVVEALHDQHGLAQLDIEYDLLKGLPDVLRKAEWNVTVTIWDGSRIVAIEDGDTSDRCFGAAMDIGTSKIVVYVIHLGSGETRGVGFIENPQIMFGEDLISRIAHATTNDNGLSALQDLTISGLNEALKDACREAQVSPENLYEATVVGNTAMHHILLGIEPRFIAASPFVPAVRRSMDVNAGRLGIDMNRNGNVHVLPVIAGFVGADAVADVLSSGIHESEDLSLLLDVGTNTELFLGNERDIMSCSCASGPAFEGGHIRHGMKAVTGAIEKISMDPRTYEVEYETIGDAKPRGLCGSAIIDIVAEMFRASLINNSGRLDLRTKTERLRRSDNVSEFMLVSAEESATGREIMITQKDIGEIQLAKAAIYTGCSILMKRKGVTGADLKHVMIAGAFGNYINPENAKAIGLIPDVPSDKMRFLGNTAVTGAKMALISREAREQAEEISKKVRYIELSADPDFKNEFASALFIPHKDKGRFPSTGNR